MKSSLSSAQFIQLFPQRTLKAKALLLLAASLSTLRISLRLLISWTNLASSSVYAVAINLASGYVPTSVEQEFPHPPASLAVLLLLQVPRMMSGSGLPHVTSRQVCVWPSHPLSLHCWIVARIYSLHTHRTQWRTSHHFLFIYFYIIQPNDFIILIRSTVRSRNYLLKLLLKLSLKRYTLICAGFAIIVYFRELWRCVTTWTVLSKSRQSGHSARSSCLLVRRLILCLLLDQRHRHHGVRPIETQEDVLRGID